MSKKNKSGVVPYIGPLSPAQGAAGIRASAQNAQQLTDEAKLLLGAGHNARAVSLALLAIEEVGKVSIIRRIVASVEQKELKGLWREFRSHTSKNFMVGFPAAAVAAMKKGLPRMDDFDHLFDEGADEPHIYDWLKQVGFYADCIGSCEWSQPSKVLDASAAKLVVGIAELMSGSIGNGVGGLNSEEALVLWQKHMSVAASGRRREAVQAFYAEAAEAGMVPERESKTVLEFLQRRA